jgi:hypothetical protein
MRLKQGLGAAQSQIKAIWLSYVDPAIIGLQLTLKKPASKAGLKTVGSSNG